MTKSNLPLVTLETIQEVGELAKEEADKLYNDMATSNPDLYRTIYGIYQLPDTTKETMLGVIVGMYHILDRQIGKGKRNRKRLKRDDDPG